MIRQPDQIVTLEVSTAEVETKISAHEIPARKKSERVLRGSWVIDFLIFF